MTRFARHILLGAAVVLALAGNADAGTAKRPVVVELFTSQGCNSCPPADELLGRLSERSGVLAMSLPITYWDMLGWKDTLASEVNTRRQKAYSQFMGHGGVYTPQIIVDGVTDVVGSRDSAVQDAIARRAAEIAAAHTSGGSLAISVSAVETPDHLHIAIGATEGKDDQTSTVWLFHIRSQVTVAIAAGENEGRTMTYHNVVNDVRQVGSWKGDSVSVDVPRASLSGLAHDGIAVVVQQGGYGRVVGATFLNHPDYAPSR